MIAAMDTIIKKSAPVAALAAIIVVAASGPAHAMHIADGILPAGWAALWWIAAVPFIAWGAKALDTASASSAQKPFVGLVGSAIFVISCMPIPIPVTGSCSHPCATGLAALLIGPRLTVAVASVALALQALFLAHGGITTFGANVVSMGIAGGFTGYLAFTVSRRVGLSLTVSAFMAGLLSDWATYATTSFELATALSGDGPFTAMFTAIITAFAPTQIPLGVMEGIMTSVAYRFIMERRPELAEAPARMEQRI